MKIVICGNYGAKNMGDEMILDGLLRIFSEHDITVLSADPGDTAKRHKVKSVRMFSAGVRSFFNNLFYRKNHKAVKECDLFVLGGGGLFGGPEQRANLIWARQAQMAYRYDKPVSMFAQSIGPITNEIVRSIVREVFKKATSISVRDSASKRRLEGMGIKQKIEVVPDPALAAQKSLPRKPQTVVALRQMPGLPENFHQKIADHLNGLDTDIVFVDFQHGADSEIHQKVIELIDREVRHIKQIKDLEALNQLFAESQNAITMRLHSIISAINNGTPFVAINYAPKIQDFLDEQDKSEHMVELDSDFDFSWDTILREFLM